MITRGTFGTFGSFAANAVLLAGLFQSLASLPDLRGALPQPLTVVHNLSLPPPRVAPWQPFINNPISPADRGPRCAPPGPQGTTFYVKEAPLPAGFNSYPSGGLARFVCVQLDRHGMVREVRLPRGSDPALVAMIKGWWRFAPDCASAGKGGWQRVRLTRWQED
jgi:hypothetical protein